MAPLYPQMQSINHAVVGPFNRNPVAFPVKQNWSKLIIFQY
jgi:hypothetical protein